MKIDLLDRAMYSGDPDPVYEWLRNNEPVYQDPSGLWGLALHEDVVWAERNPLLFSSARGSRPNNGPQPSMIDSDDPIHIARRRRVNKGFTPRRVADYEAHAHAVVTELIDCVAPLGRCDLVHDLAAPLPMRLIAEMLGIPPSDGEMLQHWSDMLISGADDRRYQTDAVATAALDWAVYADAIIEARTALPEHDLVSILAGSGMTHAELIGEITLLLIGGNETTRNAISGGMEQLMRDPAQLDALVADPSLVPGAVEECLRWVSPIINMARTVVSDTTVRGRTIPAGDQVLLMYASANRDERVFDSPGVFDIRRDPNPHVSFGFGTHFCLGASLARLEIRVMLTQLLCRLPDIRLEDPSAVVARTPSSFIRGVPSMPVVFTPV